jgi:hypothetical protein
MIERVARALAKASGINDWEKSAQEFEDDARAAIEAMREPTDAMLACGEQWGLPSDPMGLKRWQEMIDAALEGK